MRWDIEGDGEEEPVKSTSREITDPGESRPVRAPSSQLQLPRPAPSPAPPKAVALPPKRRKITRALAEALNPALRAKLSPKVMTAGTPPVGKAGQPVEVQRGRGQIATLKSSMMARKKLEAARAALKASQPRTVGTFQLPSDEEEGLGSDSGEGGSGQAYAGNTMRIDPPAVPDSGDIAGGTVVQLNGVGFDAIRGVTVQFDGEYVAVNSTTATQITITTPAHDAGLISEIRVRNPSGQVATLLDGFTYTSIPLTNFAAVAQRGGQIGMAVGTDGNSSTVDGVNFATGNIPAGSWRAAATNAGGGRIMVISDDGACIFTDDDGITWGNGGNLPAGHYKALTFAANIAGGMWFAVGTGVGTASPFTSLISTTVDDGATWTQQTPAADGYEYFGVAPNFPTSDTVVAVGRKISDGTGAIASSTNGTAWTDRSAGIAFPLNAVVFAAAGTSRWSAVGHNGSTAGRTYTSTNAAVWTLGATSLAFIPTGVGYLGSLAALAATGTSLSGGDTTEAAVSHNNGQTWTPAVIPTGSYRGTVGMISVITFIAVGDSGTISVGSGDTWTSATQS